jgi:predicted naringenin-chalcone synthase
MSIKSFAYGVAATLIVSQSFAQPPSTSKSTTAPVATSQAAKYDVSTTRMKVLLNDPDAKAVLNKYIPDLINSPDLQNASDMTLKDMQQALKPFAPNALPDEKLDAIQKDLAKLPAK